MHSSYLSTKNPRQVIQLVQSMVSYLACRVRKKCLARLFTAAMLLRDQVAVADQCSKATDIYVDLQDGNGFVKTSSIGPFVSYSHPTGTGITYQTIDISTKAKIGGDEGVFDGTSNAPDCDMGYELDEPTWISMVTPALLADFSTFELACDAANIMQPTATVNVEAQGLTTQDDISFDVDCLSYCSSVSISNPTPISDMTVVINVAETFTFGSYVGNTDPDCTLLINPITCTSVGCTDPLFQSYTTGPETIDWLITDSLLLGPHTLEQKVSYLNYDGVDTTMDMLTTFTVTIVSCHDEYPIAGNNGAPLTSIVFELWAFQTNSLTIAMPTAEAATVYPTACQLIIEDTSANPDLVIMHNTPTVGDMTLQLTKSDTSAVASAPLEEYYDPQPSLSLVVDAQIDFVVRHCTEYAIQSIAPSSSFVRYNHEQISIDMTPYIWDTGVGDYATSANCPIVYEIDPGGTVPPTWVSIPSSSTPTIAVTPAPSETNFGTFTFTVRAYYGSGYDTFDPSHIVSVNFSIYLTTRCLDEALTWDSLLSTTYTTPVGTPITVQYDQVLNGRHLLYSTACQLNFYTSGTALDNTPVPIITAEYINNGGFSFQFVIDSTDFSQVGTFTYIVVMGYSYYPTETSLQDTKTFTITLTPPDTCNTNHAAISSVYPATWSLDLCIVHSMTGSLYAATAPSYCGNLDYYFSTSTSTVFSHTNDGTQQIVNVLAQDKSYLTGGPYWVEIYPDYINDTDENRTDPLTAYHDKDYIEATFNSICGDYQITHDGTAPSSFEVDVQSFQQFVIPSFSMEAETVCASDCLQTFEVTITPNTGDNSNGDISVSYTKLTNTLTIQSTDELQIGTWDVTLRIFYQDYPLITNKDYEYDFTVEIESICLKSAVVQTAVPDEIDITTSVRMDDSYTFSILNFWTNQGMVLTPNDCEVGYRIQPSSNLISIDPVTGGLIFADQWIDVGFHNHDIEIFFVNYDSSNAQNSIPINLEITPNCRRPMSWTGGHTVIINPTVIINHIAAEGFYDLLGTSESIVNAPIECRFYFWATATVSPTIILPQIDFDNHNGLDDSGILHIISMLPSYIGTWQFRINVEYIDFPGYDPLLGVETLVDVTIKAECTGITDFITLTTTPQTHLYIIDNSVMAIPFEFQVQSDIVCDIQQIFNYKVNNDQNLLPASLSLVVELVVNHHFDVQTNDLSEKDQVYSVLIKATLQTIPKMTSQWIEFKIVMLDAYDPCVQGTFLPATPLPDYRFVITNDPLDEALQPFSPLTFEGIDQSNNPYYSCPSIVYTFDVSNDDSTTLDVPSMEFRTQTFDATKIGFHTINIILTLDGYVFNQLISEQKSFQLEISSICESATITVPVRPTEIYYMATTDISIDVQTILVAEDPSGFTADLDFCGTYEINFLSLQMQSGATQAMAQAYATGTELFCCNTDQIVDYGLYDLNFEAKFLSYGSHDWTTLSIEVEIIPDCAQSVISLTAGYSEPLDILGYIGQTVSVDLSLAFTHTFDGHYSDFCGTLDLQLEPTSTASTLYLSMSPAKVLDSIPTTVAEMNVPGEIVQLQISLASYSATTLKYFDLDTKVYPWCELTNFESTDNNPEYIYQIYVSPNPFLIDMNFDMIVFTPASTSVCDTLRIDELHFKFDHLLTDERPGFFLDLGGNISDVNTVNSADAGTYVITVTQSSELPDLAIYQNWVDIVITVIIKFDPCYISYMLDQPDVSLDYLYQIDPLTKDAPVDFDVPLYFDHATLSIVGVNCMPIEYEVGTVAEWAIIDAIPDVQITFTELTLKLAVWVTDHTLHGQTYTLTMTVKLTDYFITVQPLVNTITIEIFSKCSQTSLDLDILDADYTTWYARQPQLYFTYFVGNPERNFQVQLKDSESWILADEDGYLEDVPFCGMRDFVLTFAANDDYSPLVLNLESAQDYEPILNLFALDLDAEHPKTLDVFGVYGNTMINPDNVKLYERVDATLTVSISYFPDITMTVDIQALIMNSCERVFLYHESSTAAKQINYSVTSPSKSVVVNPFLSYLDQLLFVDFGFTSIPHDPVCGQPVVDVKCLQIGETSQTISHAIDLTPFTEDFLLSLLSFQDADLYFIEQPAFLDVKFNVGDGKTHLTIQSDVDTWETSPYVCIINAYLNASWEVARANDFAFINILGLDYSSLNNEPEIRGLDSTFQGEVGQKMQGTFTIIDPDNYDIGYLKISFNLVGEVEEDCGCVTFEGEYATLTGGTQTDSLDIAFSRNEVLTKISAEWIVTPTKSMAGKMYEVMVTVTDNFTSTSSTLFIETEAIPEEEVEIIDFVFAGVTEIQEDVVELDDGLISEEQWLILYEKKVLGTASKLSESQKSEYLALLRQTNVPIPLITEVDTDGVATIVFGQNLQQVLPEQLGAHIRIITYNYAFDLTLEVEGFIIRGEPQIAKNFQTLTAGQKTKSAGARMLQSTNSTSLYATDYELTTDYYNSKLDRVEASRADDENEDFIVETRSFNWTITSLTESEMKLKLEFNKPEFVSSYGSDSLHMHIERPELFLIREAGITQSSQIVAIRNIPKQSAGAATEDVVAASAAGSVGLQVLTLVNVGIAGMMQMSLSELWIVINSLSFIVYLPLFTFIFPDNCQMVLEAFLSVVTFDVVETLDGFGLNVIPFEFAETPPYNENFEALGYESSNTFSLLGSVNIIIFIMTVSFVSASIVKVIVPLQNTRFGLYIRSQFPFKGQLDTLNRLVISGSLEILVCTIVMVVPSQTDVPILLNLNWDELDSIDQFSLVYGIAIFAIFCTMVLLYLIVIIYVSPKVAFIEQQKLNEDSFATQISAYSKALKDQQRQAVEEQEREKQQRLEQKELQKELVAVQQLDAVDKFDDADIPIQLQNLSHLDNKNDICGNVEAQVSISDSIKSNDNFVIPFDNTVVDRELHVNKYAAMAAGFAVEFGDGNESEEENEDEDEMSNYRNKSVFQYLYKKAIVQSDKELVTRIASLKAQRRMNHMLGSTAKKLTPFQESVKHYFSDIFDGIDERYRMNYYYLVVYLLRRIAFVLTALYMTEYAHFQIMLTYIFCLFMLILLAGARPYRAQVQNTLEMINECVVLFLLLMSWMMYIAITSAASPEVGIQAYEDFGQVFTISLIACIVINFIRIMGQMAVKAKASWKIKFQKALIKAAINDRDMNFVPGSKICSCKCSQCSPNGQKKASQSRKENWGPVQPRFFQIHLNEVPLDKTASWSVFIRNEKAALDVVALQGQDDALASNQEGDEQMLPYVIGRDDALLSNPIKSSGVKETTTNAQVLPSPQGQKLIGEMTGEKNVLTTQTVSAKRVRFNMPEMENDDVVPSSLRLAATQKVVRFANTNGTLDLSERKITEEEGESDYLGTVEKEGEEGGKEETVMNQEAYVYFQHLFRKDGKVADSDDDDDEDEDQREDRVGADGLLPTNTRQVRYRKWAIKGQFNLLGLSGLTPQARLRRTIEEEKKVLEGIEDVGEMRQTASEMQFGSALADQIEFKMEQKRHQGVWGHQIMKL